MARSVWLLVAALVGWIAITGHCADIQIAEARAAAGAYEQAAQVAAAQRDSIHLASAALALAVDSARMAERRAQGVVDSVTRDVALGSTRALQAAQESSSALRASLDATQAVELGYLDRIETEYNAVIRARADQVAALEMQVSTLIAGIEVRDAVISGLRDELAAEVAIRTQLTLANEVYRGALRSQGRRAAITRVVTYALAGFVVYQAVTP